MRGRLPFAAGSRGVDAASAYNNCCPPEPFRQGAERRSARASAAAPYVSGCGCAALHFLPAARATLPRIVIGTNDSIDEGVRREDGPDAISKAGGTPALRPPATYSPASLSAQTTRLMRGCGAKTSGTPSPRQAGRPHYVPP